MELKLDWPSNKLNPNAREHWRTVSKHKKKYRADCYILAKQAIGQIKTAGKLHLHIEFYPPNKHARDLDNCVSMLKAAFDGIADAIQVDDKNFVLHPVLMDSLGGYVKIRIKIDE